MTADHYCEHHTAIELVGGPADGLRLLTNAGPGDVLCLDELFEPAPELAVYAIDHPHYKIRDSRLAGWTGPQPALFQGRCPRPPKRDHTGDSQ